VELGRQLGHGREVLDPEVDSQLVGRIGDQVAVAVKTSVAYSTGYAA
jgi:hypothetical protein